MTKNIQIGLASILIFCVFSFATAQEATLTAAGAYNQGLAKLKESNYAGGLELMEQAIEIATEANDEKVLGLAKKNGSVAASKLASASYKSGDYDQALAMYDRGIAYAPTSAGNYLGKARAINKKGMTNDAISAFLKAGQVYEQAGKVSTGQKAYKQAQTIVGKMFIAKKYDETIVSGELYLTGHQSAEVNYYLSKSFIEKGEGQKALAHINKAIELSGEAVEDKYYMAKGVSLELLGNKSQAISAYKKVSGEKYKKNADYKISTLQSN